MARNFNELRAKMSPERQEANRRAVEKMIVDIELAELRKLKQLSQKDMAERLNVQQPAVAKVESRPDLHISTLREHIEAMGGNLVVLAEFPKETVKLGSFSSQPEAHSA